MSEDLQKKLDTALSRIAALESRQQAAPAAPSAPDYSAITRDPVGVLTRAGIPIEHVTRVLVAHAMGDQAPPELRMLAQMGPQVSATQALSSELGQLRQRLEVYEARDQKQAVRSSFSALAVDKTKYPTLAAAYARDPKLFEGDVDTHKGEAAALADTLESRLRALAPALGVTPSASTANAEKPKDPSSQVKQAQDGVVSGGPVDQTPPPIPQGTKPGVFTQEEHQALKDRILHKYSKPE